MNNPIENVTDETKDCITNLMTNFSTGTCMCIMYCNCKHLSSVVGTLCTVYTVHVNVCEYNTYIYIYIYIYILQLSIVLSYILFHLSL